VFIHEGQLADVFTPAFYMLEPNNCRILTVSTWDHVLQIALKSEIFSATQPVSTI